MRLISICLPGIAAWQSTAVAWADPDVDQALRDADDEGSDEENSLIRRPGA
jgi:hypothetical protein